MHRNGMHPLSALVFFSWVLAVQLTGLAAFTKGFFLTRVELGRQSQCDVRVPLFSLATSYIAWILIIPSSNKLSPLFADSVVVDLWLAVLPSHAANGCSCVSVGLAFFTAGNPCSSCAFWLEAQEPHTHVRGRTSRVAVRACHSGTVRCNSIRRLHTRQQKHECMYKLAQQYWQRNPLVSNTQCSTILPHAPSAAKGH